MYGKENDVVFYKKENALKLSLSSSSHLLFIMIYTGKSNNIKNVSVHIINIQ
jgi:hypothetical protein